jgi:hypothetical protein
VNWRAFGFDLRDTVVGPAWRVASCRVDSEYLALGCTHGLTQGTTHRTSGRWGNG